MSFSHELLETVMRHVLCSKVVETEEAKSETEGWNRSGGQACIVEALVQANSGFPCNYQQQLRKVQYTDAPCTAP